MQGPGDSSIWIRQADLRAYSAISAALSSSSPLIHDTDTPMLAWAPLRHISDLDSGGVHISDL